MDLDFLKVLYITGALIGLHVKEPFLALTMSTTTTYSMLVPSFKQLYEDLKNTDPVALLDVNNLALKFPSKEWFFTKRYDKDVC